MNKRNLYLPILLFATLALGVLLGGILNFPIDRPISIKNSHKNKLNRLLEFINTEYVDQIDTDSIVDLTVTNILAQLDPHSVYVPPSEQADVVESMRGNFVGVGVNFFIYNDTVSVINPIKNGPSERAGIQSGDRILFIDKMKIFGQKLNLNKLFSKFKGKDGSQVELTVFRKKTKKIFKVTIIREVKLKYRLYQNQSIFRNHL
jgi:carboxyl-terminal processing protease